MSSLQEKVKHVKVKSEDSFENPQARRAFELFYNEGVPRTEEEVATLIGVTQATVNGWRRQFDWDNKVDQIRRGVYKHRAIGNDVNYLDAVDENLGIIALFKEKYKKYIETLDASTIKPRDLIAIFDHENKLLKEKVNIHMVMEQIADSIRSELIDIVNTRGDVPSSTEIKQQIHAMFNNPEGKKRLQELIEKHNQEKQDG